MVKTHWIRNTLLVSSIAHSTLSKSIVVLEIDRVKASGSSVNNML